MFGQDFRATNRNYIKGRWKYKAYAIVKGIEKNNYIKTSTRCQIAMK